MCSLVGAASGRQNYTEDDEADDGEDLDGRKPEFALPVNARAGKVDREDDDKADGDPDTVVDCLVPIIDQDRGCRQLSGKDDSPVVPLAKGARSVSQFSRNFPT